MCDSEKSSYKRSKRQLKKPKTDSSLQTQTVTQEIQDTQGYSAQLLISDTTFIGTVSPRIPSNRWTVDPNANFPADKEK